MSVESRLSRGALGWTAMTLEKIMPFIRILGILAFLMFAFSCKNTSTDSEAGLPKRELSLRSSSVTGVAPCDVVFTGTFNGYDDTIMMHVPDMFLIGGPGLTVIRYALPDTSVHARRIYTYSQHFPNAGIYSLFMVLQTTTKDIFSDTVDIIIH